MKTRVLRGFIQVTLCRTTILAVSFLLFLGGQVAGALNAPDPDALRTLLQPYQGDIRHWQHMATTILVLGSVVAALGVVVGALQASQKRLSKILTAVLGVSISVITVITNTAFDVNRRTLQTRIMQGRELLGECELMIQTGIPMDDSNQQDWLNEFRTRLRKLAELGKEPEMRAALFDIELVPRVFAQSSKAAAPGWIGHPPSDSSNIYFIGTASDPSLSQARILAAKDANQRASAYLSGQLQTPAQQAASKLPAASDYVLKSASTQDSYFTYDPAIRAYRYYVLMRVQREVAENDLSLYALQNGANLSPNWKQAVQTAAQSNQYPPALAPVSRQYRVEQRHFVVLDLLGNVGLYVGDVHKTRPARVVIFVFPAGRPPDPQHKFSEAFARQQLADNTVLADKDVARGGSIDLAVGGVAYRLTFDFVWRGVGTDSAVVTAETR